MAKSEQRLLAISLRQRGKSLKDISEALKISKSSASLWCRNVTLTNKQIDSLNQRWLMGTYRGRLKGAMFNKEMRQKKIEIFIN